MDSPSIPASKDKLCFEASYNAIVCTPEIEQLFISHLESCYSLENLLFLQESAEFEQVCKACRRWKDSVCCLLSCILQLTAQISQTNINLLKRRSKEIFQKYISANAEKQVNLPSNVVKQITTLMQQIDSGDNSVVSPQIFAPAQEEIKNLLAVDVLPYFVSKQGEEIKK